MDTKTFTIIKTRHSFYNDRPAIETTGTLAELIEHFHYTLETGKSYEHERGRARINMKPGTAKALVNTLNKAVDNAAANGHSATTFILAE